MKELDESFKQTVDRAVTPFKEDTTPEQPSLDDQNKTFRTRLVGVWLLSNAALSIAITSINGLDQSQQRVQACFPAEFNPEAGAIVVPMNGTCITSALSSDAREVQGKQQVGSSLYTC